MNETFDTLLRQAQDGDREAAQQLLLDGIPASEAALRTGFGDYSNFYRTYRRLSGHSPAEAQRLSIL